MSHHLTQVNQTYLQHFFHAMSYSFTSFKASLYFLVHAIFPDLFVFNGSREIEQLNNILVYQKMNL